MADSPSTAVDGWKNDVWAGRACQDPLAERGRVSTRDGSTASSFSDTDISSDDGTGDGTDPRRGEVPELPRLAYRVKNTFVDCPDDGAIQPPAVRKLASVPSSFGSRLCEASGELTAA